MDLSLKYPKCAPEEADAHAWAFIDKDTFELYPCKFPEVGDNEIRAKVLYTGLCLSDLKSGRQHWGPRPMPACTGHEVIARVSIVGKDVKDRKVGDIIGCGPLRDSCQACDYCETERDNVCTGMGLADRDLYVKSFGGYCTSIQIRDIHTHPIPEGMDIKNAPPLLCAGVTVFRPLKTHCVAGQKVAVLGIGGLGHLGVQFAKALGLEVTAFTRTESKVEYIKSLGADHVIVVDEAFEVFKPLQNTFDAILNTLPVADPDQMNQYLGLIKPCGKLLQVGVPPVAQNMAYGFFPLVGKQIEVIGSLVGSISETREMLDYAVKYNIKVRTEDYSFEDFPKALDKLENGRPLFRCVVNVEEYAQKHNL